MSEDEDRVGDIELISRFNNGNGGVSLIVHGRDGDDEATTGRLLSPQDALALGIRLVEKVLGHGDSPEISDAIAYLKIRASKLTSRVVAPAVKSDSPRTFEEHVAGDHETDAYGDPLPASVLLARRVRR